MSIRISTKYPCPYCEKLVNPDHNFCPECGKSLYELEKLLHYNIFYRYLNGEEVSKKLFNLRYLTQILTPELAIELGKKTKASMDMFQVFIGAYFFNDVEKLSDDIAEIHVREWIKVKKDGTLSQDRGRQFIKVSMKD